MSATVVGCGASKTAIELVPQDANLIAVIQVSKIINDRDLRDAYDETEKDSGQPQTIEEALDELVEEVGVDLRDCQQAVIFADTTGLAQVGYLGVIIEGSFDEEQFIDNIEEKTGEELTTSDYKGHKLYAVAVEGEEFGIAFLSDTMLLLGTPEAVKDAIDVSKGDKKKISGTILDAYNRLGDALIKFAFEVPEEAREALTEGLVPGGIPGEIPISLDSFEDIDILGFAISKEADTLTVQITPHFLNTDSAQDAKDTLSGAISLFKGTLQVPEMKELLGKIEVTVADSWVTVALEITVSEIEKLMETFPIGPQTRLVNPREVADTELANIQAAVTSMMVDNELPALPNPVTVATNDMSAFPDTSVCGVDRINDYEGNAYVNGQDKDGYVLYGYDPYADADDTRLVNYVATRYTSGTYTVDASGRVTKVTTGFE